MKDRNLKTSNPSVSVIDLSKKPALPPKPAGINVLAKLARPALPMKSGNNLFPQTHQNRQIGIKCDLNYTFFFCFIMGVYINQIDAVNNEENDDSINGYEIPINKTDHRENESMLSCIP